MGSDSAKRYNEKRAKAAQAAIDRELDTGGDSIDFEGQIAQDTKDSAMGKGDEELYEKKMSKEEKKALAKAKREAKKKMKKSSSKGSKLDLTEEEKKDDSAPATALDKLSLKDPNSDEAKQDALLEELSKQEIVVTYEQKKGNLHANTRDINVSGVSVAFHGKMLIEETQVVINYGNRYGFIGPNGSGKVCLIRIIVLTFLCAYHVSCFFCSHIHVFHIVNCNESNCSPSNSHPIGT